MTSGLHRWEVHIDRCISKNIFIGVCTADIRVDNYCGCDRNGWAFLANKAMWHNKSKSKTYGELFRTGDSVLVTLDLDNGTLSYSLNGLDLGIAAEGLIGPLYPAFSLYNEEDQISISMPRLCPSSLTWRTATSERILDRLEVLQNCAILLMHTDKFNQQNLSAQADSKLPPFESNISPVKDDNRGSTDFKSSNNDVSNDSSANKEPAGQTDIKFDSMPLPTSGTDSQLNTINEGCGDILSNQATSLEDSGLRTPSDYLLDQIAIEPPNRESLQHQLELGMGLSSSISPMIPMSLDRTKSPIGNLYIL
jgi:hypothetical protein